MWQGFPFPTGIQIVLMKHEQEIAMKLLKYFGIALALAAFLTLSAHIVALGLYALCLLAAVAGGCFFFYRS
jgi:hypothetical protein